jgi:poly-beta-hydroxyalkanoate depolymerase
MESEEKIRKIKNSKNSRHLNQTVGHYGTTGLLTGRKWESLIENKKKRTN